MSRSGFALLALLTGTAVAGAVFSAWERRDPLASSSCNNCHVARNGGSNAAESRMLLVSQEKLCITCHRDALKASHPSGVQPSMAMPGMFPLDWKGDLTCSSCHHIHAGGHGRLRSDLQGRQYCLACHQEAFFQAMKDKGTSILFSGHLKERQDISLPGIDAYSRKCMACHDKEGNLPDLSVRLGKGVVRHSGGTNHPIGVSYAEAARSGSYHPVNRLPKEIMLPEGMVSCVSCHEGYSKQHGKVIPEARCVSCHDL